MVSINKNIFTNKDNGLSLSNSKKNTDELFAELFSILHSSDNLNNIGKTVADISSTNNNNNTVYNEFKQQVKEHENNKSTCFHNK